MKKIITLLFFATITFATGFAQTCDTLFNMTSITDTPTVYYADTGTNAGYLSGNNKYGDLAKAEGFNALVGDSIYEAAFYFAVVTISPSDSDLPLTIAVWDNAGVGGNNIPGAPGNMLDTVQVTLRQIAQVVTDGNNTQQFEGLLVNFTRPVAITTSTIYVGVVLPGLSGDTVALFTNIAPPGTGGDGWEYEGDPYDAWGSYNVDWNIDAGSSMGNYISALMCGTATTAVNTLSNDVEIKIFPNPANDQLNLQWNLNDEADVTMYSVTGASIKSFTIRGTALNTFDIHELAQGAYIIRVTDRVTNQQRSMLFTKM